MQDDFRRFKRKTINLSMKRVKDAMEWGLDQNDIFFSHSMTVGVILWNAGDQDEKRFYFDEIN